MITESILYLMILSGFVLAIAYVRAGLRQTRSPLLVGRQTVARQGGQQR